MTFRERLTVPAAYWAIATAFGVTFIVAIGGYFPQMWFAVVAMAGIAVIACCLLLWGGVVICVDDEGVRVGRSLLAWPYVAGVTVHEPSAMRVRLSRDADARAFLCVRPYIAGGVEITLDDPADSHPYWLLSSRHRDQLAAAIRDHLPGS